MRVFLLIAIRNLVQSKRRTLLIGAALLAVTCLLVLLLALSQGLSETMIRSATTLSSGHVNVSGFFKVNTKDAAPIVTNKEELKRIVRESTPGLAYVIDRSRGWAKVVSDTSSLQAGLTGVELAQETALLSQLQMAPESAYKEGAPDVARGDARELADPGTALIFESQAKRLEVGVGDMLTLTTETMDGRTNTAEVRVVAVAKDVGFMSNWNVFVPTSTILDLYKLKPDTAGAVMVYLDDIRRSKEVMDHLATVLADKGYRLMDHDPRPFWMKFETVGGEDWTGQKLDLTIWEDEVSFLTWTITAVDTISFILVAVLVFIIGVGIMNTMWIAVRERTREVGTLRAIGMTRGRVLGMFMLEALVLGAVATGIGAAAGALIGVTVDAAQLQVPLKAMEAILMSDTLHLAVKPGQIVGAVVAFTVLTGLSALGPALRAARLQPITAIHHIG